MQRHCLFLLLLALMQPIAAQVEPVESIDALLAEQQAQQQHQEAIRDAEAKLAAARTALAQGKEPLPGERSANAAGGSRLNDAYFARQAANESAVTEAEQSLAALKAGE